MSQPFIDVDNGHLIGITFQTNYGKGFFPLNISKIVIEMV